MKKQIDLTGVNGPFTIQEAAGIVKCTVQNIYNAISTGKLESETTLGIKTVKLDSLSKWREAYYKRTDTNNLISKELSNVEESIKNIKNLLKGN